MSKLTYSKKKRADPFIIKQTGRDCFHCNCENSELNPLEYGHLNANDEDNRPENLAYMCHACNIKQKFSFDMQILSNEQLKKNEKAMYVCERTKADSGTKNDLTSCQEINKINVQITKQWLQEHTINGEMPILNDSVYAIVNICQDNNGSGSQAAVYKYVESEANPYNGKYTIVQNKEGKNCIRRRELKIENRNLKVI